MSPVSPVIAPRPRRPATALAGLSVTLVALFVLPTAVDGHELTGRYESPLPLVAYLAGAAAAVALSFAFVLLRATPPPEPEDETAPASGSRTVPGMVRLGLKALGLLAWAWIVVQAVGGEAGSGDVASLFLWVYGWVGLAIVCAFVGPAWQWFDPFTTLYDVGAAAFRRLGVTGWSQSAYPPMLDRWPAVGGFLVFVWLELVFTGARSGRLLAFVLVAYTAWTLLMMSQFGRDTWRSRGEVFSVWFGTIGRLAPVALDPGDDRRVVVRRPASGLLDGGWTTSLLVLVAIATGAIIFDGLSQTQAWQSTFGPPALGSGTIELVAFLGAIVAIVLAVARLVGLAGLAAGLVPISIGYLVAHYLTYLLFDGQRILLALSDPLGRGWNLLGLGHFEPSGSWLPAGAVWALQLLAVVGGHVVGAMTGHGAALRDAIEGQMPVPHRRGRTATPVRPARRASAGTTQRGVGDVRLRQVPLAIVMILLTTLTLWSLGQAIVKDADAEGAAGWALPAAGTVRTG